MEDYEKQMDCAGYYHSSRLVFIGATNRTRYRSFEGGCAYGLGKGFVGA